MKYLGIHKLLWLLLVTFYTLCEALMVFFGWVAYLLWNLEYVNYNNLWQEAQEEDGFKKDNDDRIHFYKRTDNNILETIYRRYHLIDNK